MARSLSAILIGFLVAGSALTLPIATRSASAAMLDKKSNAEANEALGLYKEGRYEEAAKLFVKLSIDYPDMLVFVRNIGACYYYLRRTDPALSNLREYLRRKKNIAADDRTEVEGWIAELENLRKQGAALPAPAPLPPTPTAPVAGPTESPPASPVAPLPPTPMAPAAAPAEYPPSAPAAGPVAAAAPVDQPAPAPPPQPNDSGYPPAGQSASQPLYAPDQYSPQPASQYPPAGPGTYPTQSQSAPAAGLGTQAGVQTPASSNSGAWVVGGIGVALLAAGGVFTYLSQSAFSDTAKRYDSSKESSGKTYADVGAVFYGVGAAGVVTAIIMMAAKGNQPTRSVALVPVVRPNAVGAVIDYTY